MHHSLCSGVIFLSGGLVEGDEHCLFICFDVIFIFSALDEGLTWTAITRRGLWSNVGTLPTLNPRPSILIAVLVNPSVRAEKMQVMLKHGNMQSLSPSPSPSEKKVYTFWYCLHCNLGNETDIIWGQLHSCSQLRSHFDIVLWDRKARVPSLPQWYLHACSSTLASNMICVTGKQCSYIRLLTHSAFLTVIVNNNCWLELLTK